MGNDNDVDNREWIDERLAMLATADRLEPDLARARARVHELEAVSTRQVRRVWIAITTACLLLAILPWPRAAAQQLWNRLTLARVEIVQVRGEHLPESITTALTMEPRDFEKKRVMDLTEAERLVGFRPALPPAGLLHGSPTFSVVDSVTLETKPLKTADIERALAAAGASEIRVPAEWEGTTLMAKAGPVLVAEYDGVELMQSAPFRMTIPAGIDFRRFMEMAFRVFGRSASEAKILGQKLAANPALIMHFPDREPVRDVVLRSGRGILVGDPDGPDGICFFWNEANRIFIVSADRMSEQSVIVLADSIAVRP